MKFTIVFDSLNELNLTLLALSQLPYNQVQPLIDKVTAQGREQEKKQQEQDGIVPAAG